MKKIFTLLILQVILCTSINAQDSTGRCTLSSLFCPAGNSSLKMGRFAVTKTEAISYYKTRYPAGYTDVHYKLNYCPFKCPVPNGSDGCDTDAALALYYYVYYPTDFVNYDNCSLPAIIMFHSGAYSECSNPDQEGLDYFCRAMASRGFVVFSCSYRVGVLTDQTNIPGTPMGHETDPKWQYVSAQQILAIYRACQDARGAIRSIILANSTETRFKISTTDIFVGGMSAGSLIAMNAVYYQNQTMIDAVFPGVSTVLGDINPDFYAAPPPVMGAPDYFPNIIGVINLWGSMFIPKANLNNPAVFFASDAYKPPIISFAGVQDQVFDIHNQPIYFSKSVSKSKKLCGISFSQNFGVETNCLITSSYTTPQFAQPTIYQYGIGSETIFHMFDDNGIFTELNLDCEMMHGLDRDCICGTLTNQIYDNTLMTCVPCTYQSNFGTTANNQILTYDYMAGRIATFLQAIITNHTNIPVHNKFVEQENKRYGCTGADNPPSFIPNTCDDDPHQ